MTVVHAENNGRRLEEAGVVVAREDCRTGNVRDAT